MPEPLTTQLVAEQMQKLLVAFPSRNLAGQNIVHTAEVYRNGLRGLSGDALRAASDIVIQNDVYFPKVARLREVASEWTKRNAAIAAPHFRVDELYCHVCQSRVEPVERWRPCIDMANQCKQMRTADGYVLLERYERLLCKCAAPCLYAPLAGLPVFAMRPDDIGRRATLADAAD